MTNDELITTRQDLKLIKIGLLVQGLMLGLIIFFILFNIILEFKWIDFLKQKELDYVKNSSKVELSFGQMINIIGEQLELIKEQRKENQILKEQLTRQNVD